MKAEEVAATVSASAIAGASPFTEMLDAFMARKMLREARREQRKEKIQAKLAELKAKLHIDRPVTSDRSSAIHR